MNWLTNLSGCPNPFKEMDLLEEHLNFWAKVCAFFPPKWLGLVADCKILDHIQCKRVKSHLDMALNGLSQPLPYVM